LSDHTLDINIRKCNYNKFNFSEIEDYVRELVGSRDYQYDAIKQIMIYLWGGGYKSIADLGKVEKDRVRWSFDLDDYISRLESEGKEDNLEEIKKLQDERIETLIKVVEIKSG